MALSLATYLAGLVGQERAEVATALRSLNNKHVRGMAQGMRSSFQSFSSATAWSMVTRSGHRSKKGFARAKVVFATTYQPLTPFSDVDLPNAYDFQCAIEPTYLEAITGLASSQRYQFLFGGQPTASYLGPGTNTFGFIESDWLYFPYIASDQKFGLWTLVEQPGGLPSVLPMDNQGGSRFINRNEGVITASASQKGSLLTLNAVNALATNQLGGSNMYTPAFLLIDYDEGDIVVAIDGDSTDQGTGEGNTGSGSAGDVLGSATRNAGAAARGINDVLGLNYAVNIAKGSDGGKFKGLASAVRGRMQLLRKANPTHIFAGDAINDLSGGTGTNTVTGYVANKSYYQRGDVVNTGGGIYVCTRTGVSGGNAAPNLGTTPFVEVADNSVRWVYLMPDTGAKAKMACSAYGKYLILFDHYREAVPGIKICKKLCVPVGTSSDGGLTQTPNEVPTTGARDLFNNLFKRQSNDPILGVTTFFDPAQFVEYNDGSGVKTGQWATAKPLTTPPASGVANFFTQDMTHPNSNGALEISLGFTLSLFP